MKMSGNTILITGGGSGIGRELARRFQELGNAVIVAGRRQDSLDETIDGRDSMHAMTLDVEDADAVEAFGTRLLAEHPAINVLVNNAGIMRREDLTGSRDLRDAEETISINLPLVSWFFSFSFLPAPMAYGSSWARDETQATAVTWVTAVTMPDP